MVAENGRNHESVIGDASVQDAFRGEINEGSRVDPPLVFGGAAPPSEWPCEATQNCVATQLRFGHSGSCTLPKGFRTVSVKFRPRRATLTRRCMRARLARLRGCARGRPVVCPRRPVDPPSAAPCRRAARLVVGVPRWTRRMPPCRTQSQRAGTSRPGIQDRIHFKYTR